MRTFRRRRLPWAVRYVGVIGLCGALVALIMTALSTTVGGLSNAASAGPDRPIVLSPLAVRSYIYDRNGGEMAVLYAEEDREEIPLASMPDAVQRAVLAVEDRDFYSHDGVNLKATFRALATNIQAGGIEQGGSTITQQLIKNSVVGNEQTFARKAREAVLALQLENQMSKKQILERYLNTVYLGNGAYGIEAFAETYFNTTGDKLGWGEAALMTSLIRNPVGYDPIRFPTLSTQRRALVVERLVAEGDITSDEGDAINESPLPTKLFSRKQATESTQLAGANYFSEAVKQQLLDLPDLGATAKDRYNSVFKGGLRISTTYDPDAQQLAEKAVATLPDTDGQFTAALSAVDPTTGAVRAVVGGTNFEDQKFNYATQGWRQPGSSFKFFTLMAAFNAGVNPNDTISGASPCRFPDPGSPKGVYSASNSGSGGKTASVMSQTLSSSNCAFLRLAQYVGLDKVAAMANSMGTTTLVPQLDAVGAPVLDTNGDPKFTEGAIASDVLSLPIGSKEVHPLQMAAAYATAANEGVYHSPFFIDKVTDAKGALLYQHQDDGRQVVSSQTARQVTEVLAKNVVSGTGRNARLKKQPAAGKTGTTQENADVWFVGYTPQIVTSVWIGSPTDRTRVRLGGKTQFGADYPSKIWKAFMEPYHANRPIVEFPPAPADERGTSLRYSNTADKGRIRCVPRPTRPCAGRRTATTTVPGSSNTRGPTGGDAVVADPPTDTSPPAISPPSGGGA